VVPLWLQLLQKMWRFTEFHDEYRRKGWKQSDFASGVGCVTDLSPYLSPTDGRMNVGFDFPPGYCLYVLYTKSDF